MKLNPKVIIYDDGYVYNSETGESFFINETGKIIIDLIKQNNKFEEIKSYFLENYDIKNNEFERYFYEFIDMLKFQNILRDE
ncbi:MAG: PqqD family protein [Bacteroidales bacterium]|nr:PqqD family protein [Bacteroidales bacterium]